MSDDDGLRIAIIGAGISGLSAAYYCAKNSAHKTKIKIFERNENVGGNAQTRVFSLGKHLQAGEAEEDFIRWADLGVNDINLTTYKRVSQVMRDIGYLNDRTDKCENLKKLEDTVCFFEMGSDFAITDDGNLVDGVSDPRFAIEHIQGGVLPALAGIINKLAIETVYPDGEFKHGSENLELTVREFFEILISDTKNAFAKYAAQLRDSVDPDWDSTGLAMLVEKIEFLRDKQFYPRISAMYFANDYGAEDMLLAAPFLYYCIQEGVASKEEADRRYFVGGSQRWIEYFAEYLEQEYAQDDNNIEIALASKVKVLVEQDQVKIVHENKAQPEEVFDYVIVTSHADDAQQALMFARDVKGNGNSNGKSSDSHHSCLHQQESEIRKILSSISYTSSVAVAHTYSELLPANRNAWRCYNVLVREGVGLKPYSMTYVCNRHQNDVASEEYHRTNHPQFFVTLNPQVPIPDDYILDQVETIPSTLHAILPEATRLLEQETKTLMSQDNAAAPRTTTKCVTRFRHNLMNRNCFEAQRALAEFHKASSRLFFGGGWTFGAGLHEECFEQSETIASIICSKSS